MKTKSNQSPQLTSTEINIDTETGSVDISLSDGSKIAATVNDLTLAKMNGDYLAGAGEWGECEIGPELAAAAAKQQHLCSDRQIDAVAFELNWGALRGEIIAAIKAAYAE